MKVKKSSLNKLSKRVGCLFFAILMLLSLATPAFAAVNVDGQGGSSVIVGGGANTYNASDQMWKVSIFYARHDTSYEKTSNLYNTSKWVQYGKTFYMYNPTAVRGQSGKIKLNYFKNALFVAGNKAQFLSKSSTIPSNFTLSFYSENYFYENSQSPAIAMDGYTIDAVKEFFGTDTNFVKLAKEAYKAAGYSNWSDCFVYPDGINKGKKVTFNIDEINGSDVDKTANSGKAQNGYTWDITQKHLTFNDWYKGIKTDYNGKQIYLHPKTSNGTFLSATAWIVVYEPVLCVEVGGFNIGGSTYKYVACTPTEFAILQQNGIVNFSGLGNAIYNYLSNSTYLDEKWVGISARSSAFTKYTALNTIYQQAGIGMTIFDPYNYVIRDYAIDISMPESVKVGESFTVTYKAVNNTSNAKSGVPVVFAGIVNDGGVYYLYDMYAMSGKSLTKDNAIATATSSREFL